MRGRRQGALGALVIAWKAFSYTLSGLVLAFVVSQLWFYGHIVYWRRFPPANTAFMERSLEALQAKDPQARLRHQWVPYERISANLKRAVVAAEDARFLDHEGFDWEMIQKAIARNEERPGGAANVARNAAALGAQVTLISVVGDDEAGDRKSVV